MSVGIDGAVEVIADVAGSIAYGIGSAAVAVGKAIGKGSIALAEMTARATKELGGAFAASFDEVAQLQKLRREQNEKEKKAYRDYLRAVEAERDKQAEFIRKLNGLVDYGALGIEKEGKEKIDRLDNARKIRVLNELTDMQGRFFRLRDLFFGLSEHGVESDIEYDFFEIKNEFANKVNGGDFDFGAIDERVEKLFDAIRGLKIADGNRGATEFVAAQFYKIENEWDTPQLLSFRTELYEMLRLEKEHAASDEDKLFDMENEVWQLAQLFDRIDHDFPEKREILDLIGSVKSELLSEHSAATKLSLVETRYRAMTDTYKKIRARDEEAIELKRRYNDAIALNYMLKKELGSELPVMDFRYETAESDISALSAENEALSRKLVEKQKHDYIRKTVRETMRELQFEYLCSQTKVTSSDRTVYEDVYHIDNGNVVSVTFVDGRAYYSVSGVRLAGIPEDKKSVKRSMEKMCAKSGELQERLAKKGVRYTIDRRIEPDEDYAREIELNDASASVIERLRREKLGKKQEKAVKRKTIS